MDTISTHQAARDSKTIFTLFSALALKIRLKIWHLALSRPRIIFIQLRSYPPFYLVPINPPHPLYHINHESRMCALKTHIDFQPVPNVLRAILNPEIDYTFFIDSKNFEFACSLKVMEGDEAMWRKIRRIAVPLASWETLVKERDEQSIILALQNFPKLEEIVLVVGEGGDELLKSSDMEFVMPKEVPRSPVLMQLTMEVFQPWRAFADLFAVEMMEDAVGKYVEAVLNRAVGAGKEPLGGMSLPHAWTAPKFKIREVRFAREAKV